MDNAENYIAIMIDSLKKKIKVLDKIIELNGVQKNILSSDNINMDEFQENMDEKSGYVDQLGELDDGFAITFERVKKQLDNNKELYKNDIGEMKKLISMITERSVKIQSDEQRNKALVEKRFSQLKQSVIQAKRSGSMASNYYKSMSKVDSEPQFIDHKN